MIYLISGGSGSGKSKFAEDEAVKYKGRKLYIATMENKSSSAKKRILKHRNMRQGKGFETLEKEKYFKDINLSDYKIVLLECLPNLTANHIYGGGNIDMLYDDVDYLLKKAENLIIVTNDISSCALHYDEEVYKYMKVLNKLACRIAEHADKVIEVTAGIPIYHKGEK